MPGHETLRLVASIAHASVLALLALFAVHRVLLVACLLRRRATPPPLPPPDERPAVTIQIPVFEEAPVIERTLDAVSALEWPRDRFAIQVLDDSRDETVDLIARKCDQLRARGVNVAHLRRETREGWKAGALARGLEVSESELVAIFDADFAPAADFLERTTPWFQDPRVGLVQARWEHANRGRSLLTRAQALLLDAHFSVEQEARARTGRPLKFNGTAGVFRRAAIEEAGGWQADTLTEDLDLSVRAQLRGWRFVFVDEVTVPGELPEDLGAVRSQQRRWVRGSAQSLRKLTGSVLRAPLPLGARLEALLQLGANAAHPLALALALLSVPVVALGRPRAHLVLGSLTTGLFVAATLGVVVYLVASQRRRGVAGMLEALLLAPFVFALGLGLSLANARAFLAGLFPLATPFVRTPKRGDQGRVRYRSPIAWGEIAAELLVAGYFAWGTTIAFMGRRAHLTAPFQIALLLGFGLVGLFSLTSGLKAKFLRDEFAHPASNQAGSALRTLVRRWAPGSRQGSR